LSNLESFTLAKEERASGGGDQVLQSESDKLVEELITLREESEKKGGPR